jgi:chorismate mutase / prephenate dehydratase
MTKQNSRNIEEIRKDIDSIDKSIVQEFLKRMDVADEIASYKKEHDLPILDKAREREKIQSILDMVPDDKKSYTMALFNTLFEVSKSEQASSNNIEAPIVKKIEDALESTPKTLIDSAYVACQGVEGAFSEIAAEKLFKHPNISFFPNFRSVFKAVDEGFCKYGILPFENSTAGVVNEVYELMKEFDFYIVKTIRLKVSQNLLAKPGVKLDDITDIYSHQKAIEQSSRFLVALKEKGVKVHIAENTAMACKMVSESESKTFAAIGSSNAANIYNLDFIEKSIEDNNANYTRFAVISNKLEIYPGADRTSLAITTKNEAGSLYKVLARFNTLEINLSKLESRTIPNRDFDYMFYFDLDCSVYSPEFRRLMSSLDDVVEEYRYLGSYSELI